MLDSARKQRLTREALGSADAEMRFAAFTFAVLPRILFVAAITTMLVGFHQQEPELLAVSDISTQSVAAHGGAPALPMGDPVADTGRDANEQRQGETGTSEPEGNVVDLTY